MLLQHMFEENNGFVKDKFILSAEIPLRVSVELRGKMITFGHPLKFWIKDADVGVGGRRLDGQICVGSR